MISAWFLKVWDRLGRVSPALLGFIIGYLVMALILSVVLAIMLVAKHQAEVRALTVPGNQLCTNAAEAAK
jgi:hypothetical protein